MDTRTECLFLLLPVEIRFQIYREVFAITGVHVFLWHGQMRMSKCITAPGLSEDNGGFDGLNFASMGSNVKWMRRLQSTWGNHWACEEVALGTENHCNRERGFMNGLFHVCKTIYLDLVEYTCGAARSGEAAFHITNSDVLCQLEQSGETLVLSEAPFYEASIRTVFWIKHLNVTLRFPFVALEKLDEFRHGEGDDPFQVGSPLLMSWVASSNSQLKAYLQLHDTVKHFASLETLHAWLDHDELVSWSHVNERVLLIPMERISQVADLAVSVNLPKLHPRWERHERHYCTGIPANAPPFEITRRLRQRFFCVGPDHVSSEKRVVEHRDFPAFYPEDVWQSKGKLVSQETIEEFERFCWQDGDDPQDVMAEVPDSRMPHWSASFS